MKKKTITTYFNDDGSKVSETTTETECNDGIIGVCDGDCVNCEDPSLCDDSMDIGELLDGEREVDLYEVIAKALSLTALFFSAATAIKAWKKIR